MKSLKNNAGQSSSSSKILEKLTGNLTANLFILVCRSSAPGAWRLKRIHNKKKKNLLSNFQEFLDEEELCPARFFIDFMLQNVVQN